jgi:hypothetical protein
MSAENSQQSKPFAFAIQGEPTALLMEMLVQIRASLDVMMVFNMEMLAILTDKNSEEIAARYTELKEKFLLEHAFKLQEDHPPPTE